MTMTLVQWGPFRDLMTLQDRMNRLFDESMRGARTPDEAMSTTSWSPAVDIYETENEIVLKAELPEVNQKEIDLQVANNTLTISGERKFDESMKKENFHRIERAYGLFSRSFTLPSLINQEKIKAEYKDGVLRVELPKRDETKPKQIKVAIS
jgi:HSP20 family protein